MAAPTFKKATDTDPGDSTKYGAPDVKYVVDVLDATHPTDRIQATSIETTAGNVQTDIDSKAAVSHTHPQSEITNLVTDLSNKSAVGHAHTASDVTDFSTAVSSNVAVAANTAKNSYPSADSAKLAGIATGANLYVHPNHTGDVTSTGDGATAIDKSAITGQTEELVPASGDFVLGYEATSDSLRKFNIGNFPTGGGGEINDAVNIGTAGVGIYKQKTGLNVELKKINAGSAKITVTDDTGNDEVDVDLGSVASADLSDSANISKLDTVQTITAAKTFLDTTMKLRNVANTFSASFTNTNTADRTYTLPDASATLVGTTTTQALINKTLSSAFNTITINSSNITDFATATTTRTNISIDQDGTGNNITNIDVPSIKAGSSILEGGIPFLIDGGGAVYTTGIKGIVIAPSDLTITGCKVFNSASDTVSIDINRYTSIANYNAGTKASITASAPAATTSAKSADSGITGWTTSINKGDILEFEVDTAGSTATWTEVFVEFDKA